MSSGSYEPHGAAIPRLGNVPTRDTNAALCDGHLSYHLVQAGREFEFAKSNSIDHWPTVVQALRDTTKHVIHAWASCHKTILHRLSGGVDSAIVLAGLATAPSAPNVVCHNLYTPGANGDERKYARESARKARCQLVERERNSNVDLEVFRTISPSVSPMRHYNSFENVQPENELAREVDATAVLCGSVGDQIFGTGVDERVALEFVTRHGIRPALLPVALDVAQRRKVSVWNVLGKALRASRKVGNEIWHDSLFREKDLLPSAYRGLVSDKLLLDIRPILNGFVHPWFRTHSGVPEYSLWLISGLTAEMNYDAPFTSLGGPPGSVSVSDPTLS